MRSLLSRLAFWWSALAVALCLMLPPASVTWVAALAVVAAALSLLIGRGGRRGREAAAPVAANAIEDAGLLDTAALVVRSAVHAHDLAAALHGVARALFQQLGAEGLITGRLDDTGALLGLDHFADPAAKRPALPTSALSAVATEAVRTQRVAGSVRGGFAVPVVRAGRTAGWLEFKGLEIQIATPALLRLLELVRLELSAVAERSVVPGTGKTVAADAPMPETQRRAAPPAGTAAARARRPTPNATRPQLTRYPKYGIEEADGLGPNANEVLDHNALNRLRQLDPNGVDRLLERVVKAFEVSATRLIPQLREGARTGDANGLRQVASALRSASASIGAVKLSQLCADIETQADAPDRDSLATWVRETVGEIDVVLTVLRSLPVSPA